MGQRVGMPMLRRETLKALEHRLDDVMTERKQNSKMRTLGASNPYNNNKDKHRNATKITGDSSVSKIFSQDGMVNAAMSNTDDDDGARSSYKERSSSELPSSSGSKL